MNFFRQHGRPYFPATPMLAIVEERVELSFELNSTISFRLLNATGSRCSKLS
jgi:hypothetical protein